MKTLTITEMAQAISAANGWSEETRDKIHRQIRHWHKHGILTSIDGALDGAFDRRGTARFEPYSVLKARLLIALSSLNLEIEDIRSALYGIEPPANRVEESRDATGRVVSTPKYDEEDREKRHLRNVIRGIACGESWFCTVVVFRDSGGRLIINANNERQTEIEISPKDLEDLCDYRRSLGHSEEVRVTFSLSDKLKPFLHFIEA